MAVVDDIGSFPLPAWISKKDFDELYKKAWQELAEGQGSGESYAQLKGVFIESFEAKLESGLDIATYPQHYDMHRQFLEPIEAYGTEPFLIDPSKAALPEIKAIVEEGANLAERLGSEIRLRACVTGPIELYLKTDFGTNVYKDVLSNLAKSVNSFLKQATVSTRHVRTASLSIDEPSLGFVDLLNTTSDDLVDILELAVRGLSPQVQIHLHTLRAAEIPLQATGISVLTGEFAASPENMRFLSRRELEEHDKFLRAGVARTNIDSIIAEHLDRGVEPGPEQLVDPKPVIKRRVERLSGLFKDRIVAFGPDCGLGGWPGQEVAKRLLARTVEAVKESFK